MGLTKFSNKKRARRTIVVIGQGSLLVDGAAEISRGAGRAWAPEQRTFRTCTSRRSNRRGGRSSVSVSVTPVPPSDEQRLFLGCRFLRRPSVRPSPGKWNGTTVYNLQFFFFSPINPYLLGVCVHDSNIVAGSRFRGPILLYEHERAANVGGAEG